MAGRDRPLPTDVQQCLDKVSSSVQKTRNEGFEDLKHILSLRQSNPQLAVLKDVHLHKLLEKLFTILEDHKRTYLKASTPVTRTRATTALQSTADAVRTVVETLLPQLQPKTVKAIIDHVVKTLPDPRGQFCSPLKSDYINILNIVLTPKSNVETLPKKKWDSALRLCISGLDSLSENDDHESSISRTPSFAGESNGTSRRSTNTFNVSSRTAVTPSDGHLLSCLLALISAPNAVVLMHAKSIISSVLPFLLHARAPALSNLHLTAFQIINVVLMSVIADDIEFCKNLAVELVQIIARLWPTRMISVKDEMLGTLLLLHLHLESIVTGEDNEDLVTDIRELSDTMSTEYSKRIEREQLQLGDLDLAALERAAVTTSPLSLIRFRAHNPRAERNWMLLKVLGILNRLGYLKGHPRELKDGDEDHHPRKRRRFVQQTDDLIHAIRSHDNSKRFTALQTLPFVLEITELPEEDIVELLTSLCTLMTNGSGPLASWAMLGIASCTTQSAIQDKSEIFDWAQIWHVGGRLVTSPNHSRAACHVLHSLLAKGLVKYHDIAEDISAIVSSPELGGPAILADSSLSLMAHLVHLRNMEMPGSSSSVSQAVIKWAFSRWDPIYNIERNVITNMAHFVQPIDFINLLRTCLGMARLKLPATNITPCTSIGQMWHRLRSDEASVRYLLLLEDPLSTQDQCPDCPSALQPHELGKLNSSNSRVENLKRIILELCLPKIEHLVQYWETSAAADRPKQVSTGAVCGTALAFLIGSYVVSLVGSYDSSQLSELSKLVKNLASTVVSFTNRAERDWLAFDETLLQTLHPYLPSFQIGDLACNLSNAGALFSEFVQLYAAEIKSRSCPSDSMSDVLSDDDMMPMNEDSSSRRQSFEKELPRDELSIKTSTIAFNYSAAAHIILLSEFIASEIPSSCIPEAFFDYMLSLQPAETLLCRNLLQGVLQSDLQLSDTDMERVFDHYAGLLENANYSGCEVLRGICLDLLLKTATIWTQAKGKPALIVDMGTQLYDIFLGCASDPGAMSQTTMMNLATLLFRLTRLPLSSSLEEDPFSGLLNVLYLGDNTVKFHIVTQLPHVFELHALGEHEKFFDRILEKLPSDPNCHEGIALRMHAFALLCSKWSSLARRGVYHIFECPGQFQGCSDHARSCLARVSKAIGLQSPRELFHLFSSQILFTWLEDFSIESIPFQIFGYETLIELVLDVEEDIIALLMMRAQSEQISNLASLLDVTVDTLVEHSFAKIVAYTTAYDYSTKKPEGAKIASGDVRIREILDKEKYRYEFNLNFADIIALFFSVVDQTSRVDKLFSQSEHLIQAGIAMDEMMELSNSIALLPTNHQPNFNPKFLPDELEFACKRVTARPDPAEIYTPALVTFVARKLFNLIHPALGSLHACSIIRRIRIFVCMAGATALEGYPLEMLLLSFRPYLTDPHCVEDTIGIVQYLFEHGKPYLSKSPAFVSGIALSILASLRQFLRSSQSNLTNENQHASAIEKVEEFHEWFGNNYLMQYTFPETPNSSQISFQELVRSAYNIRSTGNANLDSPESNFLLNLLKDEQSDDPLLNRPSRDQSFALLCTEFQQPDSFFDDILGSDEEAASYSAAIWSLCRNNSMSPNFLAWGAKVIGRAFVANGAIHEELLRESEVTRMQKLAVPNEILTESSVCILQLLQALTLGNNHKEVDLVESSLRTIVFSFEEFEGEKTQLQACQESLSDSLFKASSWKPFWAPPSDQPDVVVDPTIDPLSAEAITRETWLKDLSVKLCLIAKSDPVVYRLPRVLQNVQGFAEQAFPFILHSVLSDQLAQKSHFKKEISTALRYWWNCEESGSEKNVKLLINAMLYLLTQPLPGEHSRAERSKWLDINYIDAASAAVRCSMFKTALLFVELSLSPNAESSRRSSVAKMPEPTDILLSIFRNIDDPDCFYGVSQSASLSSVLSRLEYEQDGFKSLSFRGAQYDSNLRRKSTAAAADADSLIGALGVLRQDGLSHSLISAEQTLGMSSEARESMFRTARKLEQWDIPVPETSLKEAGSIYRAFQVLNNATDLQAITSTIDEGLRQNMNILVAENSNIASLHTSLQSISILTEMHEVLGSRSSTKIEKMLQRFEDRAGWMRTGRFDDIGPIISCRETLLSSLSQRQPLREMMNIPDVDARLVEVRTSLLSSKISRAHGALQESLASATYLTKLIEPCEKINLHIDAAVNLDAADALWEFKEMTSSMGILRELIKNTDLKSQSIPVGKANLYAKLGYQISTARLEPPDHIIKNYLQPALSALKGKENSGIESGKVYHEFAAFCDQQLQDPIGIEELQRLRGLRDQKEKEIQDLKKIARSADKRELARAKKELKQAEQWFAMDNAELTRLFESRASFLRQSLVNYLRTLVNSDDHDRDALRFLALWLENSDREIANTAVSQNLQAVPTYKFAPFMNQLTSRLLHRDDSFQKLLYDLVFAICKDHPFHGMYQIWASARTASNSKDETAMARQEAAKRLTNQLGKDSDTAVTWNAVQEVCKQYCSLAADDGTKIKGERYKSGSKIRFKDSQAGKSFVNIILRHKIPPPTLHVEIRPDRNYYPEHLPSVHRIEPVMDIASGVSAPKILTVVGSDGRRYKQLVKGSNDDLRQDAIMEQVFEQVSNILQTNRTTRQRNLSIRTYKVVPLTPTAGIIEFVPNSMPLNSFVMPAHQRYYPNDASPDAARKLIQDNQTKSLQDRIKAYRMVTGRFHPVMRYFFIERFDDPDEWFSKRLAYTRSTAANSIVGHILGLGDRHGQNILIDEKTGEAVHIDFGFAFESGRVLPIPETVPFRLTRDVVDGFGITGTEGVFRRCCEFTLAALQKESYPIMTVLDVLRYDPLYSWTVSPQRLAKLRDQQKAAPNKTDDNATNVDVGGDEDFNSVKLNLNVQAGKAAFKDNEPAEAERALTVIRRKLGAALSVEATVNDLIVQATDERNLAVLFCGWAPYA